MTPARSFITHDESTSTITVHADEKTEAAVYEDFELKLILGQNSYTLPVKVSFTECTVNRLTFRPNKLAISYKIGSGILQESLPGLK